MKQTNKHLERLTEKHLAQGAEMVLCITVNNLFPPKKYGANFKCPKSVPHKAKYNLACFHCSFCWKNQEGSACIQ